MIFRFSVGERNRATPARFQDYRARRRSDWRARLLPKQAGVAYGKLRCRPAQDLAVGPPPEKPGLSKP
jgi:hypothetical protein